MNRKSFAIMIVTFLIFGGLILGGVASAKRPDPMLIAGPMPVPQACPYKDVYCPDVYDPVTCDNGVTYPNACYALIACATGCYEGEAYQ